MHPALFITLLVVSIQSRPILQAKDVQKTWQNRRIIDPKDVIKRCFCPAGYQPRKNCSARSDVVCEPCPKGFYSDAPGFNACKPCQACGKKTMMVSPCTPTHQAICTDVRQLFHVCHEFPPDFNAGENSDSQYVMEEYNQTGPSNQELTVVIVPLAAMALIFTLILKKRMQRPESADNSRAVENADFFHKAGSIYQTDAQAPVSEVKQPMGSPTFIDSIFSRIGFKSTVSGEQVKAAYCPLAEVACRNPRKLAERSTSHEVYCPPSTDSNKMALDSSGFYKNTFDSEGGTLAHNEVAITICKLSIPRGRTYTIKGKTHTRIQEWNSSVEPGEVIIAPPLELHVEGEHVFDDHVTVCIPHCIQDMYSLACVRVYWGDKSSGKTFVPIPRMGEKKKDTEAFYVADEDHVYIHAKHFNISQFVCTISGSQINLQLQVLAFYEHYIVGDVQHLKIKISLCDSRNNIPDLREAYFEQEGRPLVPSCSWQPLELPLGYATPNTEVMVELIRDDKWEEAIYGEMRIPLRLNQKLVDVLNQQNNCLAEFSLKRNIVGKPATKFRGTLILGSSERIEEKRDNDVVVVSEGRGRVIRRGNLRGRGGGTCTIETNKSSREELPVDIELDCNDSSCPKAFNEKIQDGIAFVAQNLSSTDFPRFYRRLGLKEADIDSIRERFRDDFHEQKMQMLLKWQQRLGKMASTQDLLHALQDIDLSKMADDLEMDILQKISC